MLARPLIRLIPKDRINAPPRISVELESRVQLNFDYRRFLTMRSTAASLARFVKDQINRVSS